MTKTTWDTYKVFRIGSEEIENDACLHSVVVSRHHACITRHKQEFYIEDLNSTNGTYVNGILLEYTQKQKLQPMDRVIFADVECLYNGRKNAYAQGFSCIRKTGSL